MDYMINLKSELEIRLLHEKIDHLILHQQLQLVEVQKMQVEMMTEIAVKIDKVGGQQNELPQGDVLSKNSKVGSQGTKPRPVAMSMMENLEGQEDKLNEEEGPE